ncbi:SDR family NAD(P)-dependent oxidoreductase [Oryzifoliimicrobium ureilyticus]|uniref:SDR family NAD(P)-dependent oxidoreductase n=1 Tax=Oryzifoliimicrobium ureilyticus TaxID=3113724 RepID=UPI0030762DBA
MEGKRLALVTGANKGIGLEIARQLAEAGIAVIMGARDAGRGQAAAEKLASEGHSVEAVHLDLDDEETIAKAAADIGARHGRLDILVNNAGIFDPADAPPGSAALSAVRRVMNTNFIGTLAVTQAMLPLLKSASAARIVNLASSLARSHSTAIRHRPIIRRSLSAITPPRRPSTCSPSSFMKHCAAPASW